MWCNVMQQQLYNNKMSTALQTADESAIVIPSGEVSEVCYAPGILCLHFVTLKHGDIAGTMQHEPIWRIFQSATVGLRLVQP